MSEVSPEVEEPIEFEPTFGQKVWEQVSTIGLAILIALAIRAFVIEPFRIPSGSMLPTLLIGDHLFVNKFVYGVKIPFSDTRLPGLREPERGDVVVFRVGRQGGQIFPADKRPELRRDDFVKRIVGLPGERIEVRLDGTVYVNGEPATTRPAGRGFLDERGRALDVKIEALGECEHLVLDDPASPRRQGTAAFTLEPDRYFMMGDNRDHSNDSRGWGTVHIDDFKGPAFVLYWSWDHAGNFFAFLNPVNWFSIEKRWDRLFRGVKCGQLDAPAQAGKARSSL